MPTTPTPNPTYHRPADVIFEQGVDPADPVFAAMWDRAHSDDARRARLQYLSIEQELEAAYHYVAPCEPNAGAFSHKFAHIILAAANAYEVRCKALHARFYAGGGKLNIFDYLGLDRFLNLAGRRVTHQLAVGAFPAHPEMSQPFVRMVGWDGASPVGPGQVPGWWAAYNAVKHDDGGMEAAATLANATAVMAALFLLNEAVFGFRCLAGGLVTPPANPRRGPDGGLQRTIGASVPRWSRLFDYR